MMARNARSSKAARGARTGAAKPTLLELVQESRRKRLELWREDVRKLIELSNSAYGRLRPLGNLYSLDEVEADQGDGSALTDDVPYSIDPASLRILITGTRYSLSGSVSGPVESQARIRVWLGNASTGGKLLDPTYGSETLIAGNIVVDLPGGVSNFSLDVDLSQLPANAAQPPTATSPWVITASDAAGNAESDPVVVPLSTQAGFAIDPASLRATITGSQVAIAGTVKEPNSTPAILRVWMGSSSGQKLLTPPSFVEALLGGASVSLTNGSASFTVTIDEDALPEGASAQSTATPWVITACDQSGGFETAPIIVPQATAGPAEVSPTPSEPSEDIGSLAEVEGIGPERAAVLRKAGVRNAADLLKQGATAAGRRKLAKDTAFNSALILTWVNNVDLFRVIGIGGEYAELLELAGVDSVPELARRNPKDLHTKLAETNSKHNVVRRVPPPATVSKWVAGAKALPRAVQH